MANAPVRRSGAGSSSARSAGFQAPFTVARYLIARLRQLGVRQVHGVAGNYTAAFLNTILEQNYAEHRGDEIQLIGECNELIAGYAADGYARSRAGNIGVVAVTYGVGAFSLVNAIAGSMVEQVPVLLINGAPTMKEQLGHSQADMVYLHMTSDPKSNLNVFRQLTAASEQITNAARAPLQIDSALCAMVTLQQPVYLEVAEDVWRAVIPCSLAPLSFDKMSIAVDDTELAVTATIQLIQASWSDGPPLLWLGAEIQRQKLEAAALKLLSTSKLQWITSLLGKAVLSETSVPGFSGSIAPKVPCSSALLDYCTEQHGSLIGLGVWTTGLDTGNMLLNGSTVVIASHNCVRVGARLFAVVGLGRFIARLTQSWPNIANKASANLAAPPKDAAGALDADGQDGVTDATMEEKNDESLTKPGKPQGPPDQVQLVQQSLPKRGEDEFDGVSFDSVFLQLEAWLKQQSGYVVVADASMSLVAAQALTISEAGGFVAQASWLAIGYALPAAIGVKLAKQDKRVLVIIGDGGFQQTCQAMSSYAQLGHNTVILVLDNGLYGIEQEIINPNVFRQGKAKQKYPDFLQQNTPFSYNQLHGWSYAKVYEVFGASGPPGWKGIGCSVSRDADWPAVLETIESERDASILIHVHVDPLDVPHAVREGLGNAGEDEWQNPTFPPSLF